MLVTEQVGTIKRPPAAYKACRQSFIAVIFIKTCADCYNAFFTICLTRKFKKIILIPMVVVKVLLLLEPNIYLRRYLKSIP